MRSKKREVFEKTNIPEAENLSLFEEGFLQLYLNKHPKRSNVYSQPEPMMTGKEGKLQWKQRKHSVTATPIH